MYSAKAIFRNRYFIHYIILIVLIASIIACSISLRCTRGFRYINNIIIFLFNLFNLDATLDTFLQKVVRGGLLTVVVVMQGTILQRRRQ